MRRGILPIAMATVAVTATACGTTQGGTHSNASSGSGGQVTAKSPMKIVTAAYTKTTNAKTARLTLKEQIQAHAGGTDQQTTVTGHGVLDFADKSADLTTSTAQGSIEVRTINGMVYLKLPAKARSQLGGSAWAKIDLNKIAKAKTGASLSQLTGATPTDPSQQLGYLRGVSDQVKKVGTATIGGVKTTHYKATVDLDKAAAKEGTAAQHAITRIEQQLGSHTLPVDAWVDSQGRLRRTTFVEHIKHLAAGGSTSGSATVKITETLSDFGVNASIKAPPAGQTTDVTNKVLAAANK